MPFDESDFVGLERFIATARKSRALQLKMGGLEVTLHPSAFQDEAPPAPAPEAPQDARARHNAGTKPVAEINGEPVDEKILFNSSNGDARPTGFVVPFAEDVE